MEKGLFDVMLSIFNRQDAKLRQIAALISSNVLADGDNIVRYFLSHKEFSSKVLELAQTDTWNVAKECVLALANSITSSNHSQLNEIVRRFPILDIFVYCLNEDQDPIVVREIISALGVILTMEENTVNTEEFKPNKSCLIAICKLGIEQKLQKLLLHKNQLVHEVVYGFCEKYFETEEFKL